MESNSSLKDCVWVKNVLIINSYSRIFVYVNVFNDTQVSFYDVTVATYDGRRFGLSHDLCLQL